MSDRRSNIKNISDNVKASGVTSVDKKDAGGRGNIGQFRLANVKRHRSGGNHTGKKVIASVAAILIIAIFVGATVFGIYSLVKYYTSDYKNIQITYSLLLKDADNRLLFTDDEIILNKNDKVNIKSDGKSYSVIGSITDYTYRDNEDGTSDVLINLKADVRYYSGRGYYSGDVRIAAGEELDCRFTGLSGICTVTNINIG